jgi:diguanylate cyclase (GGDEF)-like protein
MSETPPVPSPTSWHSFALFDEHGGLLDWNEGFAYEFALARDLLRVGVGLQVLLLRVCNYNGVARAAAACGEDAAGLRKRLDGEPAPPLAPHSFEYECNWRWLRVHTGYTAGGRVLRMAVESSSLVAGSGRHAVVPVVESPVHGPVPGLPAANWQQQLATLAGRMDVGDGPHLDVEPTAAADPHAEEPLLQPLPDDVAALIDADTNLGNRTRFLDVLEAEWQRALYTQSAIAVAIIDLDLQRAYLKRYGEEAGQRLLQAVAHELGQGIVRSTDLVARYAERSFALMLTGASFAIAAVVAERARAVVAALDIEHEDAPRGMVTASVGFASTVPASDTGAAQLVEAAEAALLQAKLNGRNQAMGGAISNLLVG